IVGSIYGHMNIDHFILQDFGDLRKDTKQGKMKQLAETDRLVTVEDTKGFVEIQSASSYLMELRNIWSKLTPASYGGRSNGVSLEDAGNDASLSKDPPGSNFAVSWVSP